MVVAVDVGTVRVGVAASDPHRILASPVETVPAPGHARVAELVAEREAVLVVVGLPTSMSGKAASASADMARAWAERLRPLVDPVEVRLVDERLTTVTAEAMLRDQRKGQHRRAVVDQPAVAHHLDRTEDGELHRSSMAPRPPVRPHSGGRPSRTSRRSCPGTARAAGTCPRW